MSLKTRLLTSFQTAGIVGHPDADTVDMLAAVAVGIAPLFFLTVRSWTNGFIVVLLIFAIHGLFRQPKSYRALLPDRRVRWLGAALISAFIAVCISQALRGELRTDAYDGPARTLAGALILLYLAGRRIDFVRLFQWTCPISILFVVLELWLNPKPFVMWGGRWATYFVDPLTFGQYTLLLGVMSLFMINLVEKDGTLAITLKIAAFVAGVGVSIATESRSAWVALPALFSIWLLLIIRVRHVTTIVAGFVAFVAVCILAYMFIDVVWIRIDAAMHDYIVYFNGSNRDTPAGLRLSLVRATWHLFLLNPFQGYGDAAFPPLDSIPAIRGFNTPALEVLINRSGAHNEIMQNMVRSGVFGFLSTVLMIFVPLILFWSAARSNVGRCYAAGVIGLSYIVSVAIFGISTETFNLKYLSSFYALMVAALGAQIIWACPRPPNPTLKADQ